MRKDPSWGFDLFYSILAVILYIIALPILILFSFKKKYQTSLPARFFLWKNKPFLPHDIWFHVCSLGEAKALAPLLEKLQNKRIAISSITHTGYAQALKYHAQVRYLPYEFWLWFWIRDPRTIVILEAEFWYLLFSIVSSRSGRVIVLNGRISERSFPKYYRLRWFYKRLLAKCDRIFCQSREDMARFIALGAMCVEVSGNIKLAQKVETSSSYSKPKGIIIIAGSTHQGEEEKIIQGFLQYKEKNQKAKLLIVPRHPERFKYVFEMVKHLSGSYTCSRWSEDFTLESDIVLVDAMGELNNFYAISDVAILGGAFEPIGGHNPLEPAHFGCKIITGKHIFLQRELFKYVSHVQYIELEEIAEALEAACSLPPSAINEIIDLTKVIDYLNEKKQSFN